MELIRKKFPKIGNTYCLLRYTSRAYNIFAIMESIEQINSSLIMENDSSTTPVVTRKQVPRFLAIIFIIIVSLATSFLLSLFIAPILTHVMFPGAGLELILLIQFVFFALLTFFSILFFILFYKLRIAGIFTLKSEELPSPAERNANLMGLLGFVAGGILGITLGYKATNLIALLVYANFDPGPFVTSFVINYSIIVSLFSILGWKIGKMVWRKQYSRLMNFAFSIPLLISGILFLAIFRFGIIYESKGTYFLLIPIGMIVLSFVLKILNSKLAGFIVGFVLLISSFVIIDIFNSLCKIYICYVEELMHMAPRVLLFGSVIGVYENLRGMNRGNSTFSKLIGIIVKISIAVGIAFLALLIYNIIVPLIGSPLLGSSWKLGY